MLDVNSLLGFQQKTPQRSIVRVQGSGFGSTNASCRTYTNVIEIKGEDLVYQKDPVFGDRIIATSPGVYIVYLSDTKTANTLVGVTINGDPAGQIDDAPNPSRQLFSLITVTANQSISGCSPAILNQGDILRVQTGGNGVGTNSLTQLWTVVKISGT